jgi:hypothetical protein
MAFWITGETEFVLPGSIVQAITKVYVHAIAGFALVYPRFRASNSTSTKGCAAVGRFCSGLAFS